MDTEQTVKLILYGVFGVIIVVNLVRFIRMEYLTYKNREQPVQTARATVYLKHPDMEPVLAGRASTYVYRITFHTESGDALKLYMNPDAYYSIPEDAAGELVWQGEKLWRFTLEDGTEIRQ